MDKYEKEIKKFGMLHEYHDSKEYLLQNIHLVCEDTANYLTLWCVNLEVEQVCIAGALFPKVLNCSPWRSSIKVISFLLYLYWVALSVEAF